MACFGLSNLVALLGILSVAPTATLGAAVTVAPQASSDGICYKYVVQAGETCSTIAQAHSITTADIETYNARSWAWSECGQIPQGTFICLSAGEPMMPVALPNAICGPQVPGAMRPANWSELGSLNPCAANKCCSSWGLCGTTSDFCTSVAYATIPSSISTGTHSTEWTTSKQTTASTSTSTSKSVQKPVTSSKTSSISNTISTSTIKSTPKATSTTTTTRTTSTSKTASTTKSNESSQTKSSTSTSQAPTVSLWSLTMYSKKDCTGDYYVLQGHNVGYLNTSCLNLHGGLSSKYTDTGVFCKWFTNGGDSNTNCDAGTLESPQSWIVQGGLCTVSNAKDCNHAGGYDNSYGIDLKYVKSCRNRGKFDTPKFLSMECYIPE
ncbi:uncharacterized protein N7479_000746 [Penicillium vulpinum]|uniref:LysM domain-containing protein n=1 Tax=Penicillium vulpinum TaxID=29845 RepID=A0A1V6S7P1_9EURO|nr:uncharacterized protein N7479_000746 [Penicillium vulpinum]KAJ5970828.1 hypothetical protein N7479_000746 [Penicillium vulpinum]OQE09623.1 hypothetical protein PENVUL_c006G01137 [Penicillium vulpinum]